MLVIHTTLLAAFIAGSASASLLSVRQQSFPGAFFWFRVVLRCSRANPPAVVQLVLALASPTCLPATHAPQVLSGSWLTVFSTNAILSLQSSKLTKPPWLIAQFVPSHFFSLLSHNVNLHMTGTSDCYPSIRRCAFEPPRHLQSDSRCHFNRRRYCRGYLPSWDRRARFRFLFPPFQYRCHCWRCGRRDSRLGGHPRHSLRRNEAEEEAAGSDRTGACGCCSTP